MNWTLQIETFFSRVLVVGPKYIPKNQEYTLVISNFNSNQTKVDLIVKLEGETDNGLSVLNFTKTVVVRRNMNRIININVGSENAVWI